TNKHLSACLSVHLSLSLSVCLSAVLARLVWDLQSFLSVLDSENLSYIAQAQKKSISELLSKLQSNDAPVEDAEYMIMSCPSSSPSNEQTDTPGTDGVRASELILKLDTPAWMRNGITGGGWFVMWVSNDRLSPPEVREETAGARTLCWTPLD
ncbi:hypothetical protein L3Q82_023432, partial [Scortum barcoo]